MTIDELKLLEDNGAVLNDLLQIRAENLVPFVGAGISKGCGFWNWNELVLDLARRYYSDEESAKLLELGAMTAVDKIIETLDGNEIAAMRAVAGKFAAKEAVLTLAARLLAGAFSPLMVTTNYDNILEKARAELGLPSEVLLPFQETRVADSILDAKARLIKLHGSAEELSSIILSESQYERCYGPKDALDLGRPIPRALEQLFGGRRVLFVGCSLREDRTLEVLRAVIRRNQNIAHYAIVERFDDADRSRAQTRTMDSLGIKALYYPEGDHGCVETFLAYLAEHMEREKRAPAIAAPKLTPELVREDQETLRNDVLLPWMRDSAAIRAVLPGLFQKPEFESLKVRREVNFNKIIQTHRMKNLVVCGPAGAGKSMLLKYLYLYRNKSFNVCYIHAGLWFKRREELTEYQRAVVAMLRGELQPERHMLILLDGVDEALQDCEAELEEMIRGLRGSNNINVWFGIRQEAYYQMETEEIRRYIYDQLLILPWDKPKEEQYLRAYEQRMGCEGLTELVEQLLRENEGLRELASSPFQLTLLVYLAEQEGRALISEDEGPALGTLYGLYNSFFRCWLANEKGRMTSSLPAEEVRAILWAVAEEVYDGKTVRIDCADSAVTDLLRFDRAYPVGDERRAVGFYHWSFCSYLRADAIFQAIKAGGVRLAESLSKPMRNDVTDFVRSAIEGVRDSAELSRMHGEMAELYYEFAAGESAPGSVAEALAAMPPERRLSLKVELLYLITRFPKTELDVAAFLEAAAEMDMDPYIRLDLAYGAVLNGPSHIALDYARELRPGTEAELINRSWTMAYFGDVQAGPFKFIDDGAADWRKSREVRLKRFQSEKLKPVRFRIMDIPLVYCFYVSRGWSGLKEEDLKIYESIRLNSSLYNEEERAFLEERKKQLVDEYRAHMKAETSLLRKCMRARNPRRGKR